jgi:hypothetical protein
MLKEQAFYERLRASPLNPVESGKSNFATEPSQSVDLIMVNPRLCRGTLKV